MTLGEIIEDGARRLEAADVPEARLKWESCLAHRLGCGRLDLRFRAADEPAENLAAAWARDRARLAAGEPLAYVLGETVFRGLRLRSDRRALIPRPETEQLVEHVLGSGPVWLDPVPMVADAGTGTGCVALALAVERPAARVIAVDADADALALAAENRARLGLEARVELRLGDWLSVIPACSLDAVVVNPPYVATAVWRELERGVRDFEPRRALDGGCDGLADIRRLAADAARCLKPGRPLWMEIGFDQGAAACAIAADAGLARAVVHRDWSGHDRFLCAWAG